MAAVDIVGNGMSRDFWRKDPGRIAVGCNYSPDTDLICVYDRAPLHSLQAPDHPFESDQPLILGPNAFDTSKNLPKIHRQRKIVGLVHREPRKVKNAGQAAVLWALRIGFREVHLWGFDSLFSNTRKSYSDQPITDSYKPLTRALGPGTPDLPIKWAAGWDIIHEEFRRQKFHVHAPKGAKLNHRKYILVEHES